VSSSLDARSLLDSPAHAALVRTDASIGARAELAEARRRLARREAEIDALRSSASWRIGNGVVRTAAYVRVMPRKARSLARLVRLRLAK